MRNISIVVKSGEGLRPNKASYCEVEFRQSVHQTKTRKGTECTWNEQFRLGQFGPTDGVLFQIKSKKTNRVLGEAVIPLEKFISPGTYDETIPLGDGISLCIALTTEKTAGRSLARSASVKFVGRTIHKLLAKQAQEEESRKELSSSDPTLLTTHELDGTLDGTPRSTRRRHASKIQTDGVERRHRRKKRIKVPSMEIQTKLPKETLPETPVEISDSLSEHNNDCSQKVVLKPLGETKQKLFGIPLDEVMENQRRIYPDRNLTVPFFFSEAAKVIRLEGYSVQGIFRIRGKIRDVKALKMKIDSGEEITKEEWRDIHIITTLMKAFLRELPTPILNYENYDIFMRIAELNNGDERVHALKELLSTLPENNYNVIEFMFCLLHELSNNSEKTQMNAENLAKVISPNLIWKEVLDITDMSVVQDAVKGNTVALVMIEEFEKIFTR